ncbi:hypothetical protein BDZ97DRAFT_1756047 [Flammula alnicola]|nr:hypothetical protein BDZ97DRAFT_1756047 [Flammula alnicola]
MSLAKQKYPGWGCPQDVYPPASHWPVQPYEAFPGGENWQHFFHVLTEIGEPLPKPEGKKGFSGKFSEKVFNELFDRTNGLIVDRSMGTPVETVNSPDRPVFPVVILGLPTQTATDEQKRIVADLMGLKTSDIIKVYAVDY